MKFIEQWQANWVQNNLLIGPRRLEHPLLSFHAGKYIMDILNLDTHLHTKFGYKEEEHGSMEDFIKLKWGDEGVKIIRQLLGFNKKVKS